MDGNTMERITAPEPGLYLVSRVSHHSSMEQPPCEEATKAEVRSPRVDKWEQRWIVRVADIMQFVDKHAQCIVSRDYDGYAEICIYDDYCE